MGEAVNLVVDATGIQTSNYQLKLTPLKDVRKKDIRPGDETRFRLSEIGEYELTLVEEARDDQKLLASFSLRCLPDYQQIGTHCAECKLPKRRLGGQIDGQ